MAIVKTPDDRQLTSDEEIRDHLGTLGIDYDRWTTTVSLGPNPSAEDILTAYKDEVEELKSKGGYVTADVINVTPETPGLEDMLARFSKEHWHDEDEVRFIIAGSGLFHVNDPAKGVTAIHVMAGDLIRVPRGTHHWFNLCTDRRIQAIRLFQDVSGWTPHYTGTELDSRHQPLCFGAANMKQSSSLEI